MEAGWRSGCGIGRIDSGCRGGTVVFGVERLDALLNLLITVGNELLVVAVGGQRLLKCEDVFGAVVADEALSNGFNGSFDPVIAQFSQLFGIGYPRDDGVDDGQSRNSGDIADDMVNLKIHLVQRLMHMLHMHASHLDEVLAVPHQGANLANGVARGETTPSANPPNADIEAIGNPTRRIFDRAHGAHAERSPNGLQYRAPPEFGTEGSNTRRWIPWPRYRPGIAAASRPTRADPV